MLANVGLVSTTRRLDLREKGPTEVLPPCLYQRRRIHEMQVWSGRMPLRYSACVKAHRLAEQLHAWNEEFKNVVQEILSSEGIAVRLWPVRHPHTKIIGSGANCSTSE